jgi:hypothetical protein
LTYLDAIEAISEPGSSGRHPDVDRRLAAESEMNTVDVTVDGIHSVAHGLQWQAPPWTEKVRKLFIVKELSSNEIWLRAARDGGPHRLRTENALMASWCEH